jgi:alpha-tubulin suppressor-like RCC1 family protein
VAVTGGLSFAGVSEGANHTCAHTSAGTAYCWGQNASGQLGDGSATSSAAPVKVAGQP